MGRVRPSESARGGISPTGTMSRMPMVVVGGRERLSVGGSKKRKNLGLVTVGSRPNQPNLSR